jgi:PAS domain S-box-containing protein
VTADAVRGREQEIVELRARIVELERNRELLNAIANTAPSLLCLIDDTGRVRDGATNIAFERTLGYDPDDTGGVLFWERYVPAEEADAVRTAIEEVVGGAPTREHDGRWLRSDGSTIDVAWTCTALPEIESGRLFLISGTDISERTRQAEELRRSRSRLVAAGDEARKRLERNLHDGAQQHLVALLLSLKLLRRRLNEAETSAALDYAIDELQQAIDELVELARGIHPATLTVRGLHPAVDQLARRAPLPVTVDAPDERYPQPVEATAYYVASEALANVAKYAKASEAAVRISATGGRLVVEVADDGVGGADAARGSGLSGLADRVASLDGTLTVESPPGAGTRITASIPIA